jgi:hypothetical protein
VYFGSRGYLDAYRPHYMGLDVDAFLAGMERCFHTVVASDEEYPQVEIVPDTIPEIHLDPPPAPAAD